MRKAYMYVVVFQLGSCKPPRAQYGVYKSHIKVQVKKNRISSELHVLPTYMVPNTYGSHMVTHMVLTDTVRDPLCLT